jgi:hypothetical protein
VVPTRWGENRERRCIVRVVIERPLDELAACSADERSARRHGIGRHPGVTDDAGRRSAARAKSGEISGEPGGNRTHNPQIKSLLLCQLSYRPWRESLEQIGAENHVEPNTGF